MTKDLIGFVSHKDQSYLLAGLAASSWAPLSRCGNCANTSSGFVGAVARNLPRTSSTILSSSFSTNKFLNTGNLCHHRVKPDQARVTACCDCVWSLVRSSQRAKHCPLSSLWHNSHVELRVRATNKQTNKQTNKTNKQTNIQTLPTFSLTQRCTLSSVWEQHLYLYFSNGKIPIRNKFGHRCHLCLHLCACEPRALVRSKFFYEVGLKMGVFLKFVHTRQTKNRNPCLETCALT